MIIITFNFEMIIRRQTDNAKEASAYFAHGGLYLGISSVVRELDGNQLLKHRTKMFPAVCSYSLSVETVDEDGKIKNYVTKGQGVGAAKNMMIVEQPRRMAELCITQRSCDLDYYTTNQKLMKIAYQSVLMGSLPITEM